jgi:uncharacterized pyridoxal phosphate-containing UPF0001 family protein
MKYPLDIKEKHLTGVCQSFVESRVDKQLGNKPPIMNRICEMLWHVAGELQNRDGVSNLWA